MAGPTLRSGASWKLEAGSWKRTAKKRPMSTDVQTAGAAIAAPSRVLVVVDERSMRELLTILLARDGYDVLVAEDGHSGIEILRKERIDVLITDIRMPEMNGVDVLREAKRIDPEITSIVMTAFASTDTAVEALRLGAADYLVKPLDARAIVARVRSAITAFARRDGSTAGKIGLPADFPGQSLLTPREREVLTQIAEGASNKEVGRRLGISPRTVEVHRARLMEKIGARNAADLVRIVLSGGDRRTLSTSEMTT